MAEMMKRTRRAWLATLLAGSILGLAGPARAADPIVPACSKTDNFLIGFSQANNAEPYRQHVNEQLEAAAKKVPQFELQIADGGGNVNTQTSQVDNFITQKVDLLLISPFEAAPLTPAVDRAMQAGIPVIELDRKTVGEPGKELHSLHWRRQLQDRRRGGRIHRQDSLAGRRRGGGAPGAAKLDAGGGTAERLQGRGEAERQDQGRGRAGCGLGPRTRRRPPSRRCCRLIRTSRFSMPATT